MASPVAASLRPFSAAATRPAPRNWRQDPAGDTVAAARCEVKTEENTSQRVTVKNGGDSLDICRVLNGMWQTSGGWGRIDPHDAVEAMLRYGDAGDLSTFDMADIYGPAEDRYGIFINRVRRERSPESLAEVRGWDYSNPGCLDELKHLTDLKGEGKIKTLALMNFDTERLCIILENEIPVVSNQVQHSIVNMRPQQRMAELCQLTEVKLIMYGTVMGDLVSEKFLDTNVSIPFAGPPLNTPSLQKYKRVIFLFHYFHWSKEILVPLISAHNQRWSLFQVLLKTLKKVASKHGVSIPTVAVRYILDQWLDVGARLGLSEHIQDTNAVFSLVEDEEDVSSIKEVSKRGGDLLDIIGDCSDAYRRAYTTMIIKHAIGDSSSPSYCLLIN